MTNRPASPRRLLILGAVLLAAVLASLHLMPNSPPTAEPSPSPTLPPLPVQPTEVRLTAKGWWAWAILDMRTGEISGSANLTETSTTASMIKAWLVADYLRRTAEAGRTPSDARLRQLTAIIRDSNNEYTQSLYNELGRSKSIERLIDICDLTDSSPASDGGWSRTALSARDTARMGACIADGRAAGPEWTDWLLNEMRLVRGIGDFGIRDAFPADERQHIAIKNGWIERAPEREYHVSCLAIGDDWTMGVLVRYPFGVGGYEYGMKICEKIATQLRAAP